MLKPTVVSFSPSENLPRLRPQIYNRLQSQHPTTRKTMRPFTLPLMAVGFSPTLAAALSTSACNKGDTPSCGSASDNSIVGHTRDRLALFNFLLSHTRESH